jgi:hypothetical protein
MAESLEHRWGNRFDSGMPAELTAADGRRLEAVIRNVSLSGALVETRSPPALLSRVSVLPRSPDAHRLDAYVVRVNLQCVALEWLDPGMAALHALLSPRRYQRLTAADDAHDFHLSQQVRALPRLHHSQP